MMRHNCRGQELTAVRVGKRQPRLVDAVAFYHFEQLVIVGIVDVDGEPVVWARCSGAVSREDV